MDENAFRVDSGPLYTLNATEMLRLLRMREISCVQLMEAHLERIAQVNPVLNAVVVPLFDEAQRLGELADQALSRGNVVGPLHALPRHARRTASQKEAYVTVLLFAAMSSATVTITSSHQLLGSSPSLNTLKFI